MDESRHLTQCQLIADNIADLDARLKAEHTRLRSLESQIREAEARIERQRSRILDFIQPSLPTRIGKPSRNNRISEEHIDLMMEINRVNRLGEAQADHAAEV